jgi:predicted  nucleic acid-binding Zn-ribbon protein
MGLLDMFLTSDATLKKTILTQQKRIDELEEVVKLLTGEVQELQVKFQEASQLISYIASAQQQMALDMNMIYESVTAVSTVLEANAQEADDKYFTWRWNIKDDDDDLPN